MLPLETGFGYSLAVSGTHLLVTALNPRSPEGGAKSVYAFTRTATGWTSAGKIMPDGLPEEILLGAVALSGDLAAVAAAMPRAKGCRPSREWSSSSATRTAPGSRRRFSNLRVRMK